MYFFSRYQVGTQVYSAAGQALDVVHLLHHRQQAGEMDILLGERRLPCRLIVLPLPPAQVGKRRKRLRATAGRQQQPLSERALALAAWTLFVTNIPAALLPVEQAAMLGCTRWQIECLFKLWKGQGHLDESRSRDPHRVGCELYAKPLALLIQPWVMVVGCWHRLNRSLHQATQVIGKRALCLLDSLHHLPALIGCLSRTADMLAHTCGLSKRATQPLTFQRWLEAAFV